jgi:hypothetical protein
LNPRFPSSLTLNSHYDAVTVLWPNLRDRCGRKSIDGPQYWQYEHQQSYQQHKPTIVIDDRRTRFCNHRSGPCQPARSDLGAERTTSPGRPRLESDLSPARCNVLVNLYNRQRTKQVSDRGPTRDVGGCSRRSTERGIEVPGRGGASSATGWNSGVCKTCAACMVGLQCCGTNARRKSRG